MCSFKYFEQCMCVCVSGGSLSVYVCVKGGLVGGCA